MNIIVFQKAAFKGRGWLWMWYVINDLSFKWVCNAFYAWAMGTPATSGDQAQVEKRFA